MTLCSVLLPWYNCSLDTWSFCTQAASLEGDVDGNDFISQDVDQIGHHSAYFQVSSR